MAFALPSRAYDLEMLDRPADRQQDQGWVYGLPPGITTAQWPLDPVTGYPLMHGFTLKLPDDYRVHGEDIVALSFFATAPDHNDGGAPDDPEIREAVQARPAHPRLHRMTDILDYEYAALLLTRAEYDGAFATPPEPLDLATAERPRWLVVGGAAAFHESAPNYAKKRFASSPRTVPAENRHRDQAAYDRSECRQGPAGSIYATRRADRLPALLLLRRRRAAPRKFPPA